MNNEPVAWMSTTGKNFVSEKAPSYVKRGTDGWVPLYLHPPTKALSKQKIVELYADIEWRLDLADDEMIEFARAIEQAHGIGE